MNIKYFIFSLSIFSFDAFASEHDKGSGISIKSLFEGTKSVVGKAGDAIGKGANKVYETEIPTSFFEMIFAVIAFIIAFVASIFVTYLIFGIPVKIFLFFYVHFKYFIKNTEKKSRFDIEYDLEKSSKYKTFMSIYSGIGFLTYITLFIIYIYINFL